MLDRPASSAPLQVHLMRPDYFRTDHGLMLWNLLAQ
jgi:hypothetical protein